MIPTDARRTYDGCRDVAVERPPWLRRVLAVLVPELLVEVYEGVSMQRFKGAREDVQCASTFALLSRSPKLGRYFRIGTPPWIFLSSKSNLFRNTAHTAGGQPSCAGAKAGHAQTRMQLARSLDWTMAFQRRKESSRRLTRLSSCRSSSKHEIGARKRIALASSKYGNHAARCHPHVTVSDRRNGRPEASTDRSAGAADVVDHPVARHVVRR